MPATAAATAVAVVLHVGSGPLNTLLASFLNQDETPLQGSAFPILGGPARSWVCVGGAENPHCELLVKGLRA